MSDFRCFRPVPSENFPREFTRCLKKEDHPTHVTLEEYLAKGPPSMARPDHPFQGSFIFELQPWARR